LQNPDKLSDELTWEKRSLFFTVIETARVWDPTSLFNSNVTAEQVQTADSRADRNVGERFHLFFTFSRWATPLKHKKMGILALSRPHWR
jgi:hypothetical protein